MLRVLISLSLLLAGLILFSQSVKPYSTEEKTVREKNMYRSLSILASDSLEGREAGTDGEIKARDYIASEFTAAGLSPLNGEAFSIPFEFSEGYSYSSVNLLLGENIFKNKHDFSVLNTFTDYNFSGIPVNVGCGLKEEIYAEMCPVTFKDKVLLIDVNLADTCKDLLIKPNYYKLLQDAINLAAAKGPAAIILVSSDFENFPVLDDWFFKVNPLMIPVISAGEKLSKSLLKTESKEITCTAKFDANKHTGYNVAGMIDNGKDSYIVIGGHYDHLGYGSNSSRYNGPRAIHNGADDNASGTALVIELAKRIKKGGYTNHNYIFIAFSAEEKGLLGSKAILEQNFFPNNKVIAMLNFDMVGRLDSVNPGINVIGTGTATEWDSLIEVSDPDIMELRLSKSGLGGSDQMSFYLKDIPVLFFITGLHSDYHKPTDDIEKINFAGMVDVLYLAENIFASVDNANGLHFQETQKTMGGDRPGRKGPTLGIIPDHAWGGKGLRVDGVTEGRPASKGGLEAGDIIIKMGEFEITDIMTYMKALSMFKQGETIELRYLRDDGELSTEITF